MSKKVLVTVTYVSAAVAVGLDFGHGPSGGFLASAAFAGVGIGALTWSLSKLSVLKDRVLPIVLYAITALACALDLDSLYGAGPVVNSAVPAQIAIGGAALFAIASVLFFLNSRLGIICGVAACILSWTYFRVELAAVPWGSVDHLLPYSRWSDVFAALLMLVTSSIYSLGRGYVEFFGGPSRESKA